MFEKPELSDLVNKEIVVTNLNNWTHSGTIFTPNDIDYSFIYMIHPEAIGGLIVNEGELVHLRNNHFYWKSDKKGLGWNTRSHYDFRKMAEALEHACSNRYK